MLESREVHNSAMLHPQFTKGKRKPKKKQDKARRDSSDDALHGPRSDRRASKKRPRY